MLPPINSKALANARQSYTRPPRQALSLLSHSSRRRDLLKLQAYGGGGGPQLPGGGGPRTDTQALVSSIVSLGLFGLFVFSPLGSFFFAVTNGIFLLALSVPLMLFAAFTFFNAFLVVKGECPSCGSPAAALRNGNDGNLQTSACLNCGATLRSTRNNKGLELCNPNPGFGQEETNQANPFTDIFGGERAAGSGRAGAQGDKDKEKEMKRENTIIDIDVEE